MAGKGGGLVVARWLVANLVKWVCVILFSILFLTFEIFHN